MDWRSVFCPPPTNNYSEYYYTIKVLFDGYSESHINDPLMADVHFF